MISRLLALLLFLPLCVAAEDDIVVSLPTRSRKIPVYVGQFAEPMNSVLRFDLEQSGRIVCVDVPRSQWRDRGVIYSVDCAVEGEQLRAKLTRVSSGAERTLRVPLTSERRAAHQLADALHEELFGVPGIASTRLLYTIERPNDRSEVWVSDYDGHNARRLCGGDRLCVTPTFLPPTPGRSAGSYFYVNYESGQSKIYAASIGGGPGQRIINLRGNQLMPAVSAQRDQIAFVSDAGGNPDLFLQHFSPECGPVGKPQQIFSARHAAQASPTFSPDGRKLAFVSNKDGAPRIYILSLPEPGVKASNLQARAITRVNRENTCPAWSPDGKRIAYSARSKGVRQIWVYDVETGEERPLTQGPGHKENPCWAPDSEHLVFNSANARGCELYFVGLYSEPLRLTSGSGEKRFPSLSR